MAAWVAVRGKPSRRKEVFGSSEGWTAGEEVVLLPAAAFSIADIISSVDLEV